MDDVLFDWFGQAHEYSVRAGIAKKSQRPTQWECYRDYGCTLDEWFKAVYPMAPEGVYLDRPPIRGAVSGLKRIKDAGHEVHLITSRGAFVHGRRIKKDTRLWVEEHMPWVDSLTFSSDKTEPKTDIFVDDLPRNIDQVNKAGITGVLLNRPWNKPWDDDRLRVKTMHQFADLVLTLTRSTHS